MLVELGVELNGAVEVALLLLAVVVLVIGHYCNVDYTAGLLFVVSTFS